MVIEPATTKASTSVENGTATEEQIGGAVALASWNDGRRPQRASWKPMVSTLRRRDSGAAGACCSGGDLVCRCTSSQQHSTRLGSDRAAARQLTFSETLALHPQDLIVR